MTFAGAVGFDSLPDGPRFEERAANAVAARRHGRVIVRRARRAAFVQWTPAAWRYEPPEHADRHGGLLFAADARLDNRLELGAALGLAGPDLAAISDGGLIFRMFRRWRDSGLARCLGAFAFALWEPDARRLVLARDCLGNRSLFFHRTADGVTFATTLTAMLALPDVPREIDEITVANYLAVNLGEARRTFYRGIERVPSRSIVSIDRGATRHEIYWSPDCDASPPYRRDQDYVERARELLDQAVAAATSDTAHVAISTSGGLDSSAVAATAARLGRAESVTCYTLVPPFGVEIDPGPTRYLDERSKVEALAEMYPQLQMRFFTDETPHPFERDATRLFALAGMPILGPANLGAFSRNGAMAEGRGRGGRARSRIQADAQPRHPCRPLRVLGRRQERLGLS